MDNNENLVNNTEETVIGNAQPVAPTEPVVTQPEPTITTTEPVVSQPEPVMSIPEPTPNITEPTVAQPEPVVTPTEPVMSTDNFAVNTDSISGTVDAPVESTTPKKNKKQTIILIVLIAVILCCAGYYAYENFIKKDDTKAADTKDTNTNNTNDNTNTNTNTDNGQTNVINTADVVGMYEYSGLSNPSKPDIDEDGENDYYHYFINLESTGKYYYEASSSLTSPTIHVGSYTITNDTISLKAEKDTWLTDMNNEWEMKILSTGDIEIDINLHSFEKSENPVALKKITDEQKLKTYENNTYESHVK